jgi:hypothetical protein
MRKFPSSPKLDRNIEKITPKVCIHVVCEGVNTEPEYFQRCVDYYGAGLVELIPVPGAGVPFTLVNTAIELRKGLIARKRKSPNSFEACFKVWAVFDRDDHPLVNESIALAKEHSIEVAFSDPCFEIWPLLHLVDHGAQDDRFTVQKKLRDIMPTYHHEKGALLDFNMIKDRFEIAYSRAQQLNTARELESCPQGRPSTSAGNLVKKIIENGKCWSKGAGV